MFKLFVLRPLEDVRVNLNTNLNSHKATYLFNQLFQSLGFDITQAQLGFIK